jgi:gas vesicle protein
MDTQVVTAGSQGVTGTSQAVTAFLGAPPRGQRLRELPPSILKELNDKLLNGVASRAVSEWLHKQGYRFSHKTICDYNKDRVKPALRIGAQLQAMQADNAERELSEIDRTTEVKKFTNQVLSAEPIISRINAKFTRLDAALADTAATKDYDSLAKLESQDSKAIELAAKVAMLPGFTAAGTAGTQINVQLVMLPAGALPDTGDVVDVQAIDCTESSE